MHQEKMTFEEKLTLIDELRAGVAKKLDKALFRVKPKDIYTAIGLTSSEWHNWRSGLSQNCHQVIVDFHKEHCNG